VINLTRIMSFPGLGTVDGAAGTIARGLPLCISSVVPHVWLDGGSAEMEMNEGTCCGITLKECVGWDLALAPNVMKENLFL